MNEEIECKNTDEVVCPYCGYEFGDSWEFNMNYNSTKIDCNECNKEFECSAEDTRTYSSYKIDCVGEHKMRLTFAHIRDEKFVGDGNWEKLTLEEFGYIETFKCENCEESERKEMTKEEFKKKYPDKFKITMDHYAKGRQKE